MEVSLSVLAVIAVTIVLLIIYIMKLRGENENIRLKQKIEDLAGEPVKKSPASEGPTGNEPRRAAPVKRTFAPTQDDE